MKTYNVQKRVSTETTTELYEKLSFNNLEEAKERFNEVLELQDMYAGEFNDGEWKGYYTETLEIESFDDETEDFKTIKEETVYHEGMIDKNNWKGNYANNYFAIAKWNGTELVYNFYDNGKDLNLEYKNIKASELENWYNYK